MKYVECKNLNKNKAANSQNNFSPFSENFVDINICFGDVNCEMYSKIDY